MSGTESTGDEGTSSAMGQRAPAPTAVDVGVVAAMGVEVGFLTDRLTKVRKYSGPRHTVIEGECAGKLIAVIVAGLGRAAARRGAELLLDGHRPRVLISAGFAGALDPALARNSIVLADEILDLEDHRYAIDVLMSPEDPAPRARCGKLLTVDRIIRTAAEKAELRARFGADMVDMESSGVAALCAERSIKLRSIRVISDEAGVDLPPEIATLMTKTGSYQVGAALRAIWNRPSRLKDLWVLNEHAHEAADRLAAFLVKEFERLG
jgi:adenosylhomocysteine nucleosidase